MIRQQIMVTGANGQLGKELQRLAEEFPQFEYIFLTRDEMSIENQEAVAAVFNKYSPQFLINCAAYTAVDKAEEEKEIAFRVNAEAVGYLANCCAEHDTHLVHISTDYVFDGHSNIPYKEDDAVNPQSVYGASKLKGEQLALQYAPRTIIIRSSWIYSEFGRNFVKTMLKLMAEKPSIGVVSDQVGSPTYAADLAKSILEIISSGFWEPGIYHYSNRGAISWYEFAQTIKSMIGSTCHVNAIATDRYPTPAKRPVYSVLNNEKICRVYDLVIKPWKQSLSEYLAKYDLETGIN